MVLSTGGRLYGGPEVVLSTALFQSTWQIGFIVMMFL